MEKLNLTKKTNESGTANAADTRIKSTHKAAEALATIDLCGTWQLRQVGNDRTLSGKVPGCVHLDLLSAGLIEDPFYRDNELKVQWVSEETWCYRRIVNVPEAFLSRQRVILIFEGLDTLAEIRLNGQKIGQTDNMYRRWEFDVKTLLRSGENTIEIIFASAVKYVQEHQAKRSIPGWSSEREVKGRGWIRKEPCNFGWDWGPILATCGIWRPAHLEAFDEARILDFAISQTHNNGEVRLDISAQIEKTQPCSCTARVSVTHEGKTVAETIAAFDGQTACASLTIPDPKLWWPVNLGDQPLYTVNVTLCNESGHTLDQTHRRIGLRTLVLERKPDAWGESFQFVVNGVPFFAKGANWIPADAFANRLTAQDYHRLLTDTASANMNMLRVWGGGYYEDDVFYDLCDELGICIWQDFMFACSGYPIFEDSFMQNVGVEAEQQVRRIRHHPCLALLCGNNELEQGLVGPVWNDHQMSWDDYGKLFDKLLPDIVHRLAPSISYWPGSPHSPRGDRADFNNPTCGDAHLWDVWHGRKPFEWYRTCEHRFNSEFGFQSFPEPRTIHSYTTESDRNITSFVMEFHQRSGIGNVAIIQYMLDWFKLPNTFDNLVWLSQILQGMAIKYAVEHWRRSMPRGMGTIYWQLNDCWPVASWASIDYFGRWKALHHMAKNFFDPRLISTVENMQTGEVEIHLTNDTRQPIAGQVHWSLIHVDGRTLEEGRLDVDMASGKTGCVTKLNFSKHMTTVGPRNMLFTVDLNAGGSKISSNLSLFCRPKHMELQNPEIKTTLRALSDTKYTLTLTTERPALWVWVASTGPDLRFSDNFFHMKAQCPTTIEITAEKPMCVKELTAVLNIRSLYNTY